METEYDELHQKIEVQEEKLQVQDEKLQAQDRKLQVQDRMLQAQDGKLQAQDRKLQHFDNELKQQKEEAEKRLQEERQKLKEEMKAWLKAEMLGSQQSPTPTGSATAVPANNNSKEATNCYLVNQKRYFISKKSNPMKATHLLQSLLVSGIVFLEGLR